MAFLQSFTGTETIPIFEYNNYGPINPHTLKEIYDANYTKFNFIGDYVMVAMWKAGTSAESYTVGFMPVNSDLHFYTIDFIEENFGYDNNSPSYYNTSSVYCDVGFSNTEAYIYNGAWGVTFNSGYRQLGTWYGGFFNVTQDENHSTYIYAPKWENCNGQYNIYVNEKLPLLYNYKPVDYIFGNGSVLKLSMIKEEFTNGGKDVRSADVTNIQRFTDSSNLYSLFHQLPVNAVKRLAYTAPNNYVEVCKIDISGTTHTGRLQYYTDGERCPQLDFVFGQTYDSDNPSVYTHYYLSYLVDVEKGASRQAIIAASSQDVIVHYNILENDLNLVTEEYQTLMFEWLADGYALSSEIDDPQEFGGTSSTGGGEGSYNNIGDIIALPSKPAISAVDANFVTVYNPTLSQIKSLAQYMWGTGFNLETFKKIFSDPMDCIIGLHLIPCSVPNSGVQQVRVGNINCPVTMNLVSEQFVDVDCGSIKINEYWGSYLDYSPYTKISIYLPYIGTQSLEVDDVMNKTVSIRYRIDVITGACTCFIIVEGIVMYQFSGFCLATVPVSSQDYRNTVSSIISIGTAVIGVGASIATGGLTAPMATGAIRSAASGVMNSKPTIAHGNNASGTGGFMSVQTPYVTITRARQCLPKSQNKFTGYPSYTTQKLSDLKGFTQIEEIHLGSLSCTEGEREEIELLLKGGVIL